MSARRRRASVRNRIADRKQSGERFGALQRVSESGKLEAMPRQVLTAYGTMWSETISRVREVVKSPATSRSHKIPTEPISFL